MRKALGLLLLSPFILILLLYQLLWLPVIFVLGVVASFCIVRKDYMTDKWEHEKRNTNTPPKAVP